MQNRLDRLIETLWLHFESLKKLAYDRFNTEETAEEAFNWALEKLAENNWRKLQKFHGEKGLARPILSRLGVFPIYEKQFKSFLDRTFEHLLSDYWRHINGRIDGSYVPKPIEELDGNREDNLHARVYKLLCGKGEVIDRIIQSICKDAGDRDCPQAVKDAVDNILSKCSDNGRWFSMGPNQPIAAENIIDFASTGCNPEAAMMEAQELDQLEKLVKMIELSYKDQPPAPPINHWWNKSRVQLELSLRERRFLEKLIEHAEETDTNKLNISQVGRELGYDPNQSFSIYYSIRKKIRRWFKNIRITLDFPL